MTEVRRRKGGRHKTSTTQRNGFTKGGSSQREVFTILGFTVQQFGLNACGVLLCLYIGFKHAWYMRQIHENNMWFSNIKVGGSMIVLIFDLLFMLKEKLMVSYDLKFKHAIRFH